MGQQLKESQAVILQPQLLARLVIRALVVLAEHR